MSCCCPNSDKEISCSVGEAPAEKSSCCAGECKCGPGCKCGPECECRKSGACGSKKACPVKCCAGAAIAGLLAAMVMYLFEGFWHGQYLMSIYAQTPNLWRSYTEMQAMGGWYAGVTVAMGLILSYVFSRNYEGKGWPEGVRFGFYVGLLIGVSHFAAYLYLPISLNLAVLWLCGWIVEGVLAGITLSLAYGAIYKKRGADSYSAGKNCT